MPVWRADGYCDDENNKEACNFDGGDCCDPNASTDYCEKCHCLEGFSNGNGSTPSPPTSDNGGYDFDLFHSLFSFFSTYSLSVFFLFSLPLVI